MIVAGQDKIADGLFDRMLQDIWHLNWQHALACLTMLQWYDSLSAADREFTTAQSHIG